MCAGNEVVESPKGLRYWELRHIILGGAIRVAIEKNSPWRGQQKRRSVVKLVYNRWVQVNPMELPSSSLSYYI
jgi:hypothetical protein